MEGRRIETPSDTTEARGTRIRHKTAIQRFGTPWYPNTMHGRLFRALSDEEWHPIEELFEELHMRRDTSKLRNIAYRGNMTGLWVMHKKENPLSVKLQFTKAHRRNQ